MKLVGFLFLVLYFIVPVKNSFSQVQIGVFADCQYCDCDARINRFYRNSPAKLRECISRFNQNNQLNFVVGLGDLIDHNIQSYDTVNAILAGSKHRVYQVPGNHDFEVEREFLEQVPEKLGLGKTYYSFSEGGWQFIFLNGNEITLQSNDPEIVKQAENYLTRLEKKNQPNAQTWNGGVGPAQLKWFDGELKIAKKEQRNVAVFCHYPLLPADAHVLWNSEEVLAVLNKYDHVKLWMNGHNHKGNFAFQNGIHFVNLKGMVETEDENAFAEVKFLNDSIVIKGYGREESRVLTLRFEPVQN